MTTELDTKMIPIAQALLTRFGKTATFVVPATKVYDPTIGETTEGADTNYSTKITPPGPLIRGYIPQDLVQQGDLQTFVAAQDLQFTPSLGYEILIDAESWRIEFVNPIYSGDSIALYALLIRQ